MSTGVSFKRFGAAFLSLILLISSVGPSWAEANLWKDRRLALADAHRPSDVLPEVRSVSPLTLPLAAPAAPADSRLAFLAPLSAYATVTETNISGRAGAPLLLIQDVHDNADAQGNIARILQELSRGGTLSVALEGAAGPFLSKALKAFPDPELLSSAARRLLDEKILTGAEYASLTAPGEITLWGAEEPALYIRHVEAVRGGFARQATLKEELDSLRPKLQALKEKIYPAALLEFDRRSEEYQAGRWPLGQYVRFLRPVDDGRRPQVALFLKTLDEETALDFAAAEKERRAMIEALTSRLSKTDAAALVEGSLLFRAGRMTHARFHAALSACALKYGLSLSAFPAFERYIRYVGLAESIDRPSFMKELNALEEETIRRLLAAAPEARTLFETARDHVLAGKLLRHALTPDEWALYRGRRDAVHRLPERLGGRGSLAERTAPFEAFYEAAEGRNRAMTENLLRLVPTSPRGTGPAAVLVAGGFHTPGLAALLKEKGLPYVVLTPRVEKIDGTDYLDVFRPEQAPLEKLFRGEKLTLIRELGLPARAILGAGGMRRYILSVILPGLDAAARRRGLKVEDFRESLRKALGQDYKLPEPGKSGEEAVFETDDRGRVHKILLSGDGTLQAREVSLGWKDRLRVWVHGTVKRESVPREVPPTTDVASRPPDNDLQPASLVFWIVKAAARALSEYPIQWPLSHAFHSASRFLDKTAIPLGALGAWKEAGLLAQGALWVNVHAAAAGWMPLGPVLIGGFFLLFAALHAFLAVYADNRTRGSPVTLSAVLRRTLKFFPAFLLYLVAGLWVSPDIAKFVHWTIDGIAFLTAARSPLRLVSLRLTSRWRQWRLLRLIEKTFRENGVAGVRAEVSPEDTPLPEDGLPVSHLDLVKWAGGGRTFRVDHRFMRALTFASPEDGRRLAKTLAKGRILLDRKIASGRNAPSALWETAREGEQKDFSYWVESFLAPVWRAEPAFPDDVRDILYLGGAQALRLVDPETPYSPRALAVMEGRPTLEKLAHIQWHVVRVTEGARWMAARWNKEHPEKPLSERMIRVLMRMGAYHDLGKFHPKLVHLFLVPARFPEGSIERKELGLHEEKSFEVAEDLDGAGLAEAEAGLRTGGYIWSRKWMKVAAMRWWRPIVFLLALLLSVIDVYDGFCDMCRLYHRDWGRGNYPVLAGEVNREIKRRIEPLSLESGSEAAGYLKKLKRPGDPAADLLKMLDGLHGDPEFVQLMERTYPRGAALDARPAVAEAREAGATVQEQFDVLLGVVRDYKLLPEEPVSSGAPGEIAPRKFLTPMQSSPPETWWPAFLRQSFLRDIPPADASDALKSLAARLLFRPALPDSLREKLDRLHKTGDRAELEGLTREELAALVATAAEHPRPSTPKAPTEIERWVARERELAVQVSGENPPGPLGKVARVLDGFQKARREGRARVVLATGSFEIRARENLRRLGLEKYFDGFHFAPKDKADAIRESLKLWNIPAEEAVMAGDAPHDAAAGREAKVRTLVVGKGAGKRLKADAGTEDWSDVSFHDEGEMLEARDPKTGKPSLRRTRLIVLDLDGTVIDSKNNNRETLSRLAVEMAGLQDRPENDPHRRAAARLGGKLLDRFAGLPPEKWMAEFYYEVQALLKKQASSAAPRTGLNLRRVATIGLGLAVLSLALPGVFPAVFAFHQANPLVTSPVIALLTGLFGDSLAQEIEMRGKAKPFSWKRLASMMAYVFTLNGFILPFWSAFHGTVVAAYGPLVGVAVQSGYSAFALSVLLLWSRITLERGSGPLTKRAFFRRLSVIWLPDVLFWPVFMFGFVKGVALPHFLDQAAIVPGFFILLSATSVLYAGFLSWMRQRLARGTPPAGTSTPQESPAAAPEPETPISGTILTLNGLDAAALRTRLEEASRVSRRDPAPEEKEPQDLDRQGPGRPRAGAFLLRKIRGEWHFAMGRKKPRNGELMPGRYTIAAGRTEGDETPGETAARELREEMGVAVPDGHLHGWTDHYRIEELQRALMRHAVYVDDSDRDSLPDTDELQDGIFIPLALLISSPDPGAAVEEAVVRRTRAPGIASGERRHAMKNLKSLLLRALEPSSPGSPEAPSGGQTAVKNEVFTDGKARATISRNANFSVTDLVISAGAGSAADATPAEPGMGEGTTLDSLLNDALEEGLAPALDEAVKKYVGLNLRQRQEKWSPDTLTVKLRRLEQFRKALHDRTSLNRDLLDMALVLTLSSDMHADNLVSLAEWSEKNLGPAAWALTLLLNVDHLGGTPGHSLDEYRGKKALVDAEVIAGHFRRLLDAFLDGRIPDGRGRLLVEWTLSAALRQDIYAAEPPARQALRRMMVSHPKRETILEWLRIIRRRNWRNAGLPHPTHATGAVNRWRLKNVRLADLQPPLDILAGSLRNLVSDMPENDGTRRLWNQALDRDMGEIQEAVSREEPPTDRAFEEAETPEPSNPAALGDAAFTEGKARAFRSRNPPRIEPIHDIEGKAKLLAREALLMFGALIYPEGGIPHLFFKTKEGGMVQHSIPRAALEAMMAFVTQAPDPHRFFNGLLNVLKELSVEHRRAPGGLAEEGGAYALGFHVGRTVYAMAESARTLMSPQELAVLLVHEAVEILLEEAGVEGEGKHLLATAFHRAVSGHLIGLTESGMEHLDKIFARRKELMSLSKAPPASAPAAPPRPPINIRIISFADLEKSAGKDGVVDTRLFGLPAGSPVINLMVEEPKFTSEDSLNDVKEITDDASQQLLRVLTEAMGKVQGPSAMVFAATLSLPMARMLISGVKKMPEDEHHGVRTVAVVLSDEAIENIRWEHRTTSNAFLPPVMLAGQAGASHSPSLLDRAVHWPGVAEFLALTPLRQVVVATLAGLFLGAFYLVLRPELLARLERAWQRFRLDRARARMTEEERNALWSELDTAAAKAAPSNARLESVWGPVRRLLGDLNPSPDIPGLEGARRLEVSDDTERLLLARRRGWNAAENTLLQDVLSRLGERADGKSGAAVAAFLRNVQNLYGDRLDGRGSARAFHLGVLRRRLAGTPAALALGEPDYTPSPGQGEVFEISGQAYEELNALERPVPALETLRRTYLSLSEENRARLRIVSLEDVSAGDLQAALNRYWARFNDGNVLSVPALPRAELKRRGVLRFRWTSLRTVVMADPLARSLGLASVLVRTATPENWLADDIFPLHADLKSLEWELRSRALVKSQA